MLKFEVIISTIGGVIFVIAGSIGFSFSIEFTELRSRKLRELEEAEGFRERNGVRISMGEAEIIEDVTNIKYENIDENYICINKKRDEKATKYNNPEIIVHLLEKLGRKSKESIPNSKIGTYIHNIFYIILGFISIILLAQLSSEKYFRLGIAGLFLWSLTFLLGMSTLIPIYYSYEFAFINQDFGHCIYNGLPQEFYALQKGFYLSKQCLFLIFSLALLHLGYILIPFASLLTRKVAYIYYGVSLVLVSTMLMLFTLQMLSRGGIILDYLDIEFSRDLRMYTLIYIGTALIYQIAFGMILFVNSLKYRLEKNFQHNYETQT